MTAAWSFNPDGSYAIAFGTASGLGYSSYEDIFNASGTQLAEARNMNDGSGALLLSGAGLTVSSGPGQLGVSTGADSFALAAHTAEAVTASGAVAEVLAYQSGFGQSTITGFAATGAAHDVLQVPSAMFANAATLLGASAQVGANVQITDPAGDKITLAGVSLETLAANPGDFKFV